jgi:Tfp pilus assembly protein PilO
MRNARKTLIPVLEVAALALVLLDVGLGFSVVWARDRLTARKELLASVRRQVLDEQSRVATLENSQAQLPDAEGQLKLFQSNHLSPRREAYTRASRLVRELADKAGVLLAGIGYKLEPKQDTPLERLSLEVGVDGSFPSLINFSHALETASEFIVVRNFTFTPGDGGKLALRLGADLYMTP